MLQERQQYVDIILSHLPAMVFVKGPDLKYIDINRAGEHVLGKPRREIIGKTDQELFDERYATSAGATDQRVLHGADEPLTVEESVRFGTVSRILRTTRVPLYLPGIGRALLGIAEDITDAKREEHVLREIHAVTLQEDLCLEARIRKILDRARDCFGMSVAEIVLTDGAELGIPDLSCRSRSASVVQDNRREAGAHFFPLQSPIVVQNRPYGSLRFGGPADASRPVSARETAFVNLIAQWIGHELGQAQSSRRMSELIEQLSQSNEDLETFTYIASHDLRAPLANLMGLGGELTRSMESILTVLDRVSGDLDEQAREVLEKEGRDKIPTCLGFIQRSAEKMQRMTECILELSRLGRREYVFEEIDTRAVVFEYVQSLGHVITAEGIDVRLGELPAIHCDRASIEQIFGNIIENAVKYRDPDRPAIIDIGSRIDGDGIHFTVADNGKGIAANEIHKVFEIFRRAGNVAGIPGEGMGMPFVRSIVEKLEGKIWCESTLGVGTTMHWWLPAKAAARKAG